LGRNLTDHFARLLVEHGHLNEAGLFMNDEFEADVPDMEVLPYNSQHLLKGFDVRLLLFFFSGR
jgi:predicted component of viral defense system (DUF524 family)